MNYYVSEKAKRGGDGSERRPFQTITEAAKLAEAGDEVLVMPGIYREAVHPVHAGTRERPIVYRSLVKGGAVIKGSEEVKNWEPFEGNVWMSRIHNGIFGSYNPYTVLVQGDWYKDKIKPVHTGEIYLNGKAMYEAVSLEKVLHPEVDNTSWDPAGTLYTWYTLQEGEDTVLYANFQGEDPNREEVEINVRRNCFYPEKTGVDYITVSGCDPSGCHSVGTAYGLSGGNDRPPLGERLGHRGL